jgi:hypothetical protein
MPERQVVHGLARFPVYPGLFVAAFVLVQFTTWWPPVFAVSRPLVLLVAATIAVQIVATRALGPDRGAFLAGLLAMFALDYPVLAILLGVANGSLLLRSVQRRRLATVEWSRVSQFLNVVAVISLGTSVMATASATIGLPPIGEGVTRSALASPEAPDIYLILLDGYPRADTLEIELGLDNRPFLDEMGDLGFDVSDLAHSNYNRTALTVPSLLNAAHIDDLISDPPGGLLEEQRSLSSLVNRASAVRDAQRLGYSYVHVATSIAYFTPAQADVTFHADGLTFFESNLTTNGLAWIRFGGLAIPWFKQEHRASILGAFDDLAQLSGEASPQPRLVFAHIQLPHHPLVFARDGSLPSSGQCLWGDCIIPEPMPEPLRIAFREQVEFTNDRVLALTREIAATTGRQTVIVYFSDHGFRHWMSNHAETFRSLVLASAPGHPDMFPEDSTPVNLIPRILNTYLGVGLPLAREDIWITVPDDDSSYFPMLRLDEEPVP